MYRFIFNVIFLFNGYNKNKKSQNNSNKIKIAIMFFLFLKNVDVKTVLNEFYSYLFLMQ